MSPAVGAFEEVSAIGSAPGIYDILDAAAGDAPDRVYLRDGDESFTYAALRERADVLASRLTLLGLGAGSRIALWLPNGVDFAAMFFACARIGAVAVMAGTRLRAIDIRHILGDSRADALAYAPEFVGLDYDAMVETAVHGADGAAARPRHLLSTAPSVVPGARNLHDLPADGAAPVVRDPDAPAVVCYTSGTTGRPKGCVHCHRALVRNGTVAAALTGLGADDRIVCPVPFAHVFGFHMGLLQTAIAGATLVNAEPYDPDRLLDTVEATRGTVLYAVPTMALEAIRAQRSRRRDLGALRVALIAGAPVSRGLRAAVSADDGLGCPVTVVYGCTEAPTLAQLVPSDPAEQALDSVGRATDGIEVRVVAGGTDRDVAAGEVGEIVARGYNRMLTYLGDPGATAAKYRDGWLLTGDLGRLDDHGYLHVVGRASEMFLVGAFNAYPREIEAQLEQLDGVVEAAVVGVPDERLGWVPMAWVTVRSGRLGEQEVLAWAGAELASYKRPRHVRVVESLPRTSSGKLSRVKLEGLARRALPHLPWERRDR